MSERHDQAAWSEDKILDESMRLSEQLQQPYLSAERKAQIEKELNRVAFEAWYRTQSETPATPVN